MHDEKCLYICEQCAHGEIKISSLSYINKMMVRIEMVSSASHLYHGRMLANVSVAMLWVE